MSEIWNKENIVQDIEINHNSDILKSEKVLKKNIYIYTKVKEKNLFKSFPKPSNC